MIEAPSPNRGARRDAVAPDLVVLHHTAMKSAEAALARLRDPASEVSAHWLIAEDGRIWRLVDETRRAWHAGAGCWAGVADVNSRSIGVELANPGDAPFPAPQMAALEALLRPMLARWEIPPERVIGHACMAPGRKADPSHRFDWRRLARAGLSVWIDGEPAAAPADPVAFRLAARRFGYGLKAQGGWDVEALAAAAAFRLRFRPWDWKGGPLCAAGLAQLRALAERWPARPPRPDRRADPA